MSWERRGEMGAVLRRAQFVCVRYGVGHLALAMVVLVVVTSVIQSQTDGRLSVEGAVVNGSRDGILRFGLTVRNEDANVNDAQRKHRQSSSLGIARNACEMNIQVAGFESPPSCAHVCTLSFKDEVLESLAMQPGRIAEAPRYELQVRSDGYALTVAATEPRAGKFLPLFFELGGHLYVYNFIRLQVHVVSDEASAARAPPLLLSADAQLFSLQTNASAPNCDLPAKQMHELGVQLAGTRVPLFVEARVVRDPVVSAASYRVSSFQIAHHTVARCASLAISFACAFALVLFSWWPHRNQFNICNAHATKWLSTMPSVISTLFWIDSAAVAHMLAYGARWVVLAVLATFLHAAVKLSSDQEFAAFACIWLVASALGSLSFSFGRRRIAARMTLSYKVCNVVLHEMCSCGAAALTLWDGEAQEALFTLKNVCILLITLVLSAASSISVVQRSGSSDDVPASENCDVTRTDQIYARACWMLAMTGSCVGLAAHSIRTNGVAGHLAQSQSLVLVSHVVVGSGISCVLLGCSVLCAFHYSGMLGSDENIQYELMSNAMASWSVTTFGLFAVLLALPQSSSSWIAQCISTVTNCSREVAFIGATRALFGAISISSAACTALVLGSTFGQLYVRA